MKMTDPELMVLPPQSRPAGMQANRGAYADTPGTGPAGQTCRTCKHYTRRMRFSMNDKADLKCGLMARYWTRGPGSDIKAGSPACSKWEAA